MKKRLGAMLLVFGMILGAGGAMAATNSETIQAILSYGTNILYNGQKQQFTDATGKPVYHIVYEGTTYIPVRAVSGLVGLAVDWDGATSTVYLGEKDKTPVTADIWQNKASIWVDGEYTTDKAYLVIDGAAYDSGIKLTYTAPMITETIGYQAGYFNTNGKYSTLHVTVHNTNKTDTEARLFFRSDPGENGTTYKGATLKAGETQVLDINISGADKVYLNMGSGEAIVTDMYLK